MERERNVRKYFESLKWLSELLGNGKHMDFQLWKETMLLTASILLQSAGFLIAIGAMIAVPFAIYWWMKKKANAAMQKVTTPMELVKTEHTWLAAKAIYFICMVVVYVPFMIPTILLFL